jgi:hypothetical protein
MLYIYPGSWQGGEPWQDVTTIDGEITRDPADPNKYHATFSRFSIGQPVNPTQVTVDVYVSEGGGRGHGG